METLPISQQWQDKMQGKDTFVHRLFTVFIAEEPKRMITIKDALEAQDTEQMAYLTHSLKGSAATMGAEPLRQCALDLELAGKDNDLEKSRTCFDLLQKEMDRVYAFMQERMDEMDKTSK